MYNLLNQRLLISETLVTERICQVSAHASRFLRIPFGDDGQRVIGKISASQTRSRWYTVPISRCYGLTLHTLRRYSHCHAPLQLETTILESCEDACRVVCLLNLTQPGERCSTTVILEDTLAAHCIIHVGEGIIEPSSLAGRIESGDEVLRDPIDSSIVSG